MTPNSLIESEIISNDLKLSINFLPDTGALQGNYISKEIADWLRQSGGKIIKTNRFKRKYLEKII